MLLVLLCPTWKDVERGHTLLPYRHSRDCDERHRWEKQRSKSRVTKRDLPVLTRVGNPVPPSSLRCPQAR